ncbi:MAG TPA: hypothetical protein VFN59_03040 [Acidimicrobiales bacterium]|nr:hypothetical protein [Acidimicrobiales bacterium]
MTDTYKDSLTAPNETPEEREYEFRAHIGAIWTGGRLAIGMATFLYASEAFAYFYLRTSNNSNLWRLPGQLAPLYYGWTVLICLLLMAGLANYGHRRLKKGYTNDFQVAGWTGVAAGVIALFFQIWELVVLPFYPGSSGYASTFIGFVVMNIMTIVFATYWMETTVTRALRLRKELGGTNPELSSAYPARSFRANVSSMSYYMGFVALVSIMFFLMFYVA